MKKPTLIPFAVALLLLACSLTSPTAGTAVPTDAGTATTQPTRQPTSTATRRSATPTVRRPTQLIGKATASPTRTPRPTNTPGPTDTPAASPTNTRPAATRSPDFLTTVARIKRQMEIFGGIIDLAVNGTSGVDCNEVVNTYNTVVNAPKLAVSNNLAGANQLYRQGVDNFANRARDMFLNCRDFLANNNSGNIPFQQWGNARQGVAESVDLLRQAIIAAGGTP